MTRGSPYGCEPRPGICGWRCCGRGDGRWRRRRGDADLSSTALLLSVQAELRLFSGTGDFDGEERTGARFAEEGIHRFQSQTLPAGHGLRDLGLQARYAVQVDLLGIETIAAVQVNRGARDLERERSECQFTIA